MVDIKELQDQYEAKFGKKVGNAFKNNAEWIQNKINEDGAPTEPVVDPTDPEVEAIPEAPVVSKEEKTEEPKSIPPTKSGMTVTELQSYHGITNDELYSDDTLVRKYKLNDEELATIRAFTHKETKDVDINLDFHTMPDYIQTAFHKYGITLETLKSPDKLEAIIGNTTEEEKQIVHQLTMYYQKILSEKLNHTATSPLNPALQAL